MGLNETDIKRVLWTFVQTFLATLYVTASGWSAVPNYSTAKAAVISAGVAGFAAVISLVKNLVLGDESSLK